MTDQNLINIALIGCGKMGSAMLQGWLSQNIVQNAYVLDPAGAQASFPDNVTWFTSTKDFIEHSCDPDIFILAVKPQIMTAACQSIKEKVGKNKPVLSIAAGQTIASFEQYFDSTQPIIRAMPNTPAAIGKGITVATGNSFINDTHKRFADIILSSVGMVEWVEDETLLNAVTAVSGSGPAYIFLLIEAMAKAGEKAGLEKEFAMKLARQTVIGSAALAESLPDIPAETLRQNVTSPGGTTEAALNALMKNNEFQTLLDAAIAAATQRGKELS